MTAGRCTRTVRAAVFAAVCVLLAALGHVLMSGSTVPWWAVGAGFAVTGTVAWGLAGRERGLATVVLLVVVVQAVLHSAFESAQSWAATAAGPGTGSTGHTGHVTGSMGHDPSGMSMDVTSPGSISVDSGHMAHTADLSTGMGGMDVMPMGHMSHDMSGGSSFGMLAAHTLAALLCGLWLAHGERAAFRVLRAVAHRVAAPLHLPLAVPAPLPRPRPRPRRDRSDRAPRLLLLSYSIASRGPPAGTAVV
ncbi:hypothetical protein [Streptomyces sp. GC420]|uniref:hypothetical protein n=1 Tax=Streptomyces sp. GC420 TaxID=2697568 RepID=UPI001414EBCC|nr:hypothetical protein [Streptomyces sp. GC420]NBM18055.1 hypothetical protein [Streptomyces sp. GC420]